MHKCIRVTFAYAPRSSLNSFQFHSRAISSESVWTAEIIDLLQLECRTPYNSHSDGAGSISSSRIPVKTSCCCMQSRSVTSPFLFVVLPHRARRFSRSFLAMLQQPNMILSFVVQCIYFEDFELVSTGCCCCGECIYSQNAFDAHLQRIMKLVVVGWTVWLRLAEHAKGFCGEKWNEYF